MLGVHLCFRHWCDREGYVPTHNETRKGREVTVPGRYVTRQTRRVDYRPTDLLKGAALVAYQRRASDEGWVREGGYWACIYQLPEHRGRGCNCYDKWKKTAALEPPAAA
jgi:hypothetical protein